VLITISHDRHFLNSICTHIADIDYETIITYTGGYDDMVMAQDADSLADEGQNAQREKKELRSSRIHPAFPPELVPPGTVTAQEVSGSR